MALCVEAGRTLTQLFCELLTNCGASQVSALTPLSKARLLSQLAVSEMGVILILAVGVGVQELRSWWGT